MKLIRLATHVVSMIALFACGTARVSAQTSSQPPIRRAGEGKRPSLNEQAQSNQREPQSVIGTESTPAVVRITESPEEASQKQADRERQTTTNGRLIGLTAAIALFTLGLIYVGWKQRQTYEATLAANKIVERAYVNASPSPLPFPMAWFPGGPRHPIKITNHGKTQATIRDVVGHVLSEEKALPERPEYPTHGRAGSFLLAPADHFNFMCLPDRHFSEEERGIFEMPPEARVLYDGESLALYIVGYVDYQDIFGQFYRVGWARQYFPLAAEGDRFGIVVNAHYSYDRQLTDEERRRYDD